MYKKLRFLFLMAALVLPWVTQAHAPGWACRTNVDISRATALSADVLNPSIPVYGTTTTGCTDPVWNTTEAHATSAVLSWTGSASSYVLEYSTVAFTPGQTPAQGTVVADIIGNSYTLMGLLPNTTYYVYLHSVCAGLGVSNDVSTSFSTSGNEYLITAVPYEVAKGTVTGGGIYTDGATATITATGTYPFSFSGWSDGPSFTTATRNITVTGDARYVAFFTINQYDLIASANDAAMGNITGTGQYVHNTTATLTATPNHGYHFVNWNSDATLTNPSLFLTMLQNETYVANFAPDPFTITVEANDATMGSVTGGGTYDYNTTTTLTATAIGEHGFVEWNDGNTDNPRTVTVLGDETYTATFAVNQYTIAATCDINQGTVTGSADYAYGATATLTATPASGFRFVKWNDNNTDNPRSITVNQDSNFAATFEQITLTLTANVAGTGMGTVTQTGYTGTPGTYNYGDNAYLTATANEGYEFVNWNGKATLTSPMLTVSNITEDTIVVANFRPRTYTVTVTNDDNKGTVASTGTAAYLTNYTLTATPKYGYTFTKWTNAADAPISTVNPFTFQVKGDTIIKSVYTPINYTITVTSGNPSFGTVTGGGNLAYNTNTNITATANSGYTFVSWNDGNTNASRTVTVTADASYTATFAASPYTINVFASPLAGGNAAVTGTMAFGNDVTLTATASTGYTFNHWENNANPGISLGTTTTLTHTVAGDAAFTAFFDLNNYTINALSNNATAGHVTGGGSYNHGEAVTLTPIPTDPAIYSFISWEDGNTENPRTFTATEDITLTAIFSMNHYDVLAMSNDPSLGTVAGGGAYNVNTTATLTATAIPGYHFSVWNDNNVDNPRNITVTANCIYTAYFVINSYNLMVSSNDVTMGTVTGGGLYQHGDVRTIAATPATGYHFVSWNDGNTNATRSVTVTSAASYTAIFAINTFAITTSVTGQGTVTGATTYNYNENVTLTATPATGYHFDSWTGHGTTNPLTFLATENGNYEAKFIANKYDITVANATPTMGTVTGSGTYDYGTSVLIKAISNPGYHFVAWNDANTSASRNVTVSADITYTATFAPNTYAVSVTNATPTMGTVTGTANYNYATTANLEAHPSAHYKFVSWNGDATLNSPTISVDVLKDTTLTVQFAPMGYLVTVAIDDPAHGTVTGTNTYDYNTSATISTTPAHGYTFDHWDKGGMNAGSTKTLTFTVKDNVTYTAKYNTNYYTITTHTNDAAMGSTTGDGVYPYGDNVSLIANTNSGYHFENWNDGNTDNPRAISVSDDATYTATFAPNVYTITVDGDDAQGTETGSGDYNYLTNVTIQATANHGYTFVKWNDNVTDNPRTVSVTNDETYTAIYSVNNYTITAVSDDPTMGTVDGSNTYAFGATATLTANPAIGHHFVVWNDNDSNASRDITVEDDANYTAFFAVDRFDILGTSNNQAHGTVTGSAHYDYGETATLTATAISGYHFLGWGDGNTDNPRSFAVYQSNIYVAYFNINGYALLARSNDNVMGTVTGTDSYNHGTVATLTATANPGYHFVSWNDTGTYATRTVTVTSDTNFLATFAPNTYTLSTSVNHAEMGSVTGAGTYNYLTDHILTATANHGYHFVNWTGNVTTATRTVTLMSDTLFTANFDSNDYVLTVNSSDLTMGTVTGDGTYKYLTEADLTATARTGHHFVEWSDGIATPNRTVTVLDNTTLTAIFAIDEYTLTTVANPTTMGRVTGNAAGSYDYNTVVPITAVPATGHHFVNWSDGNTTATRNVTMLSDITLTANFAINVYTVTGTASPLAFGRIDGTGDYDYNTIITLTAVPITGHHFVSWTDGNVNNPRTDTITSDSAFTATFAIDEYRLTLLRNDNAFGTVTGAGNYTYLADATVTATPATGYHFVNWSDGNVNASRTISMVSNLELTATFAVNSYAVTAVATPATMGTVTGAGNYDYNTTATLTAVPEEGHKFVRWNDGSLVNPRTDTVRGDITYTATFAIDVYALTVSSNDATMGTVTGSGNYDYNTVANITATPITGYHFVNWSDNDTNATRAITMVSNLTLTATFAINQYNIQAVSHDELMGIVTGAGQYEHGEVITLTATPEYGYHFLAWNDNLQSATRTVTVTSDSAFMAFFYVNGYALVVNSSDPTLGSVTGTGNYEYGNIATLTATPAAGHQFVSWNDGNTDNPRTVTVRQDSTFTASFDISSYSVTANSNDAVMGTVTGTGIYTHGSTATLTATANSGYYFVAWDDGSNEATRTINVTANATYTAIFSATAHTITAISDDATMGTVAGSGTYGYNSHATLTATPATGYHFASWNDGSIENPRNVTVLGDATYTATFAINSYLLTANAADATMGTVTGTGNYDYNAAATLVATATTGYHFVSWNDGNTEATRTVTVLDNVTYTATFAINSYSLTATVNNDVMGTVTGTGNYEYNGIATLTANAITGYHFVNWNDGVTAATRNVTVISDTTFVATFAVNSYSLTANSTDIATGTTTGTGSYDYNTTATLTATPATGYHFVSWNDGNTNATRTVTVTADVTYTATFAINSYALTVNSNDASMGSVTGNGNYTYNTAVTLTATANAHYHFVSWNDGNTDNPRNVNVTANATYTATFAVNSYALTVNSNDATMGTVTGTGNYNYNAIATLTASAATGYHFVNWNDGNTNVNRIITVTADATYTANFAINSYTLTVNSNDASMGTVTGSGSYNYNATATLSATASTGYHFVSWNDGNTNATRTVTVNADASYIASFAINSYTLTVNSNDASMGSVSGSGNYSYNTTATLTATPATGYHFVSWNDGNTSANRTVTVTANASYTATFAVNSYTLTVNSNDATMGTVTGSGSYNYNGTATLTATPATGYHFVSWNDGNTNATRTVTVTADASYTATFAASSFTLTVNSNDATMGTVTGSGDYGYNATATLTATANTGYYFVSWSDGNTSATRTVTVTGNATYTATFAATTYTIIVNSDGNGTVTGSGAYHYGETAVLTATAANGYKFVSWNDGNTDNPRTITVTANATYTASFQTVGIEEAEALASLSVYPNPTVGQVTLTAETVTKIEVLDGVGRKVATYMNQKSIDLSNLSSGIYTLRITTPEGTAVRRVVKR